MQLVTELKPGDHVCFAWETEQNHQVLLTQFLEAGLRRNEKVIYFTDSHSPAIAIDYLMRTGLNVGLSFASGQLRTLDAETIYLRHNYFDVDRMIGLLQSETDLALKQGYAALRATGEMTWFFLGSKGCDRLFEYESKLNNWFPGSRCIGLCQYDCRRFSPSLMRQAVATHPCVAVKENVYPNPSYWRSFKPDEPQASQSQLSFGTCDQIEAFLKKAPSST